jgi:hypothetical protein
LLFELHQAYAGNEDISGLKSYQHVGRVLLEQFDIVEDRGQTTVEVRPAKKVSASSLQNPADDEATFRRKDGKGYKGYLFNATETCAPENPLQLITDISTHQNIAADDGILAERLPEIKERTGVEEMVIDANYTGEDSERVCQEQEVAIIPTEVKGRKVSQEKEVSLTDFRFDGSAIVSCPEGHAPIEQIHKPEHGRHIARFAAEQCSNCPWVENCPVRCRKRFYSLLFNDRQVLLAQRRQQLSKEDYRRKCRLRPAIEGTISQFKRKLHNGKLRVRGLRKVRNSVILMAIGINFGRLWVYSLENNLGSALFLTLAVLFLAFLAKRLVGKSTSPNFDVD